MIHTCIPYASKEQHTNLGWVYNNFMDMVHANDWVCFLDHDAIFTTRNWYLQLNEIIKENPDFGMFSCYTNRIGQQSQKISGIDETNHDMAYHRKIGKLLQDTHKNTVREITTQNILSGVVILISKKTWKEIGGFSDGFLGVDNKLHQDCSHSGIKVGLMKGVYVYHWYRGDGDVEHLTVANSLNKNPMT